MKPMDMAAALFGNEDDESAGLGDGLGAGLGDGLLPDAGDGEAKAAKVAKAAKSEGSVGTAAMAAIAAHLEREQPPASRPGGGQPGGGFIDLAKAREEGLRNATAPQHYIDTVKRRKIASGSAKKKAKAAVASGEASRTVASDAENGGATASGKASGGTSCEARAAARAGVTGTAGAGRDENATREGGVTLLGNQHTSYPTDYDPSVLETFENKHQDNDYFVKFNCPEFTSLCPITGQPDFATIYISYVPDVRMVESKSLKLYLFSFRNHGDFHEDCMNIIMKDLIALMDPKYIEVWGKFTPRGGISIDPYVNYGRPGTRWEEVAWQRLSQHDLYPEKVDNR